MASVLALLVHRRVPIQVVENDCICTCQVDTQSTGPTRQNERQNAVVIVEPICQDLSLLDLGCTVQPEIPVPVDVEELLQDIQHLGHLGKDQCSMATRLQITKKLVQPLQFSTVVLQQPLVGEGDR